MSYENFIGLLDYLDEQLTDNTCDDTLKLSVTYTQSLKPDNIEEITEWLGKNGGYCDCEVLANVKEQLNDNAII